MLQYYRSEYGQAKFYFASAELHAEGTWHGQGAERLGLSGRTVERSDFRSLAFGVAPDGTRLTRYSEGKGRLEHRAAWDVTLMAPKSVSLAALAGGDTRLLDAFQRASDRAFRELEHTAQARAGKNRNETHQTGNLIAAAFTHFENRNLETHVHKHFVTYNLTWDEQARSRNSDTGGFRALQPKAMFAAQEPLTAVFRADIAKALRTLGYSVMVDDKGAPQIADLPEALRNAFSSRRAEVEEAVSVARAKAEARGITWTKALEGEAAKRAAKQTRQAKPEDLNPETLRATWSQVCQAHGFDIEGVVEQAVKRARTRTSEELRAEESRNRAALEKAVDLAVEHHGERESVFSATDLETHCLMQYQHLGRYDLDDIRLELEQRTISGSLIRGSGAAGEDCYTTPKLLAIERDVLDCVSRGLGQVAPLATPEEVSTKALLPDSGGRIMNPEQERSLAYLASTHDRVAALHGKAGVGKSFVFTRLSELAEEKGHRVLAFAPTLSAVETLKADGLAAVTVQSHILSDEPPADKSEVWLLDEAGMLGASDMREFLKKAERQNARVIMAGDTRQYSSVPAGRSFEQLLRTGMPAVELSRITRQDRAPPVVRDAVEKTSEGKVAEALGQLAGGKRVFSSTDKAKRNGYIANLYTALSGDTLVVCTTNEERHELNAAIRAGRVRKGDVAREGLTTEVYLNKNITKASRKEARHYERGDRVRFSRTRHSGLRAGVWYEVAGRDLLRNRVTLQAPDGCRITYNPSEHYGVEDVFRTHRRVFAVGDHIQLRGTDRALGLASGQIATIVAADSSGRITVESRNGSQKVVDLSRYKTLDYAYASTGHGAQSRTVDNVIVLLTSTHRREVVNRASLYVGTSRTRGELYLVVDEFDRAGEALGREYRKAAALDLLPSEDEPSATGKSRSQGYALERSRR